MERAQLNKQGSGDVTRSLNYFDYYSYRLGFIINVCALETFAKPFL